MVVPIKVMGKIKEGLFENKTVIDGVYFPSALIKADNNNIAYITLLNATEKQVITKDLRTKLKNVNFKEPSKIYKINQIH